LRVPGQAGRRRSSLLGKRERSTRGHTKCGDRGAFPLFPLKVGTATAPPLVCRRNVPLQEPEMVFFLALDHASSPPLSSPLLPFTMRQEVSFLSSRAKAFSSFLSYPEERRHFPPLDNCATDGLTIEDFPPPLPSFFFLTGQGIEQPKGKIPSPDLFLPLRREGGFSSLSCPRFFFFLLHFPLGRMEDLVIGTLPSLEAGPPPQRTRRGCVPRSLLPPFSKRGAASFPSGDRTPLPFSPFFSTNTLLAFLRFASGYCFSLEGGELLSPQESAILSFPPWMIDSPLSGSREILLPSLRRRGGF